MEDNIEGKADESKFLYSALHRFFFLGNHKSINNKPQLEEEIQESKQIIFMISSPT